MTYVKSAHHHKKIFMMMKSSSSVTRPYGIINNSLLINIYYHIFDDWLLSILF